MWWKFSRFFKIFLRNFVQIPIIFQNKHPINSHPKGWVWFMISCLHPCEFFENLMGTHWGKKTQKNQRWDSVYEISKVVHEKAHVVMSFHVFFGKSIEIIILNIYNGPFEAINPRKNQILLLVNYIFCYLQQIMFWLFWSVVAIQVLGVMERAIIDL